MKLFMQEFKRYLQSTLIVKLRLNEKPMEMLIRKYQIQLKCKFSQ